ncbi:MAG: four helix bundle protein [Acidobacteria bacterium]|nr:four helix bundle protein [Acidobacteriota bacterium]
MPKTNFQNLRVYQLAEKLSDVVWEMVICWDSFAKDTIGKQLVKSTDSVGANIAEGEGRGSYQDNRRFVRIARGSLQETQHWLRRAFKRGLVSQEQIAVIKPIIEQLSPTLNAYLRSIGMTKDKQRPMTNDQGQMTQK